MPTPLQLPRRRRWAPLLLAAVLFLAGGATGAAVAILFVVHRVAALIQNPQDVPPRLTRYLKHHLDLTDAQQVQVRAILERRQAGLLAIRHEVDPRVDRELRQLRADVAAVLSDDQRPQWFAMFDRARDRWLPPAPATQP